MITGRTCLAHFARDRENIVTSDASKTVLEITLWQAETNNTIRPIAFAS